MKMWKLYDTLIDNLPESGSVAELICGEHWTLAESAGGSIGIAMTTHGSTVSAAYGSLKGLSAKAAAEAVKSWNLSEASGGMAVINACYNTRQRLSELKCAEDYDHYCTHGLDMKGKTVGVIGHLKMPQDTLKDAREVFILERSPREGDYPDSACEYLLPQCDVVIITGSSLVNKTLPRLLELSSSAYTILTGPTVPLCPELLSLGIDRLAGMVVTDTPGIKEHILGKRQGPPYPYGKTFLLTREALRSRL